MAAKFPAITYVTADFDYGDTTVTIGELPENARMIECGAFIDTAFNGSSPLLDFGDGSDADEFAADVDPSSTGVVKGTLVAPGFTPSASPRQVVLTVTPDSSSAGAGTAYFAYIFG